jgi:hypothetical protein
MKKNLLFMLCMMLLGTCTFAQETALASAKTSTTTAARWTSDTHDFGKVTQGEPVTTTFSFTNTGNSPVILTEVKGSCGCTATDYTKEAVAPSKSGFVKTTYNAASPGYFHKTVTVTTSNGEVKQLIVKGEVIAKN